MSIQPQITYSESSFRMTRKAKPKKTTPRKPNLLLAVVVAIALLLLLLRMINFVAGHGHHRL
jgi:hypothetical protein